MSEYQNYSANGVAEDRDINYSLVKVFGYMFGALFITAVVMLSLAGLFRIAFGIGDNFLYDEGATVDFNNDAVLWLFVAMIASSIGLIVLSFVMPAILVKGEHSILIPGIIYSVLMGVSLACLAIFIPWYLIGTTFGISSVIFGILALIAFISKGRLKGIWIVGIGLVLGGSLICLFLWILSFFINVTWLYWVVSLAVFVGMMLITIVDVARIKTIAEQGDMTNNTSLYCAYILYNDFIHIFIRVLRILLIVVARTKR